MSRLIDADEFEKKLSCVWKWLVIRENEGYGTTHGECLDKIHDILINQPTAYNVDKVVEELEGLATNLIPIIQGVPNLVHSYDTPTIIKAIEIVKRGGKNE